MTYCPFCEDKIIDNQSLLKQENSFVLYNYQPFNPGHVMVVPKRHADNLRQLNEKEFIEMFTVMKTVSHKMDNYLKADNYIYQINEGHCAGQEVMHVHFHFIPRYNDDWLAGKKPVLAIPKLKGIERRIHMYRKMFDADTYDNNSVYSTDLSSVILSSRPWNKGHCYVQPKSNPKTIRDCTVEEVTDIAKTVMYVSKQLYEKVPPQGFNYRIKEGNNFKVEIIPRNNKDIINRQRKTKKNSIDLEILTGEKLINQVERFKKLF